MPHVFMQKCYVHFTHATDNNLSKLIGVFVCLYPGSLDIVAEGIPLLC